MSQALAWFNDFASSVTAGLALAICIGGLSLHSDVRKMEAEVAATKVLAQSTDVREQELERSVTGIKENIDGLRRDVDKVADAVDRQAAEAAKDRALILQELGRLQGRNDGPPKR